MKQLIQSPKGVVELVQVATPALGRGEVLVRVGASLISAGTERMITEFASKSLIGKARTRPDLVRKVLDKARREGILSTLESVVQRLDEPLPLGYSCAGTVIAVEDEITDVQPGDRVACAGAGYAVHAEVVSVPRNLVAKVPELRSWPAESEEEPSLNEDQQHRSFSGQRTSAISFEEAAFATIASVALHGFRVAETELGERVAVIGLGLIGQIAVQLAKAAGCRVLGMDPVSDRCRLAEELGCDATAVSAKALKELVAKHFSPSQCDAVIITASTSSNEPVELAGAIARDRGVIVAVGAVGTKIPRKVYYEKELTFRISRSYGPGRYDPDYEEEGHDYPVGYVRWTENRNMEAFLQLVAEGKVNVRALITHRFPIQEAAKAYDLIAGKLSESFLGVLINYPGKPELSRRVTLSQPATFRSDSGGKWKESSAVVSIGLLGAGNFAKATLLPAMRKVTGVELVSVCTATGLSGRHTGNRFRFHYSTTDQAEILNDPKVNTVVIATRHHLHAAQLIAALKAGKNVFCEKPLCLNRQELAEIIRVGPPLVQDSSSKNTSASNDSGSSVDGLEAKLVMVGFNRRFAPMAVRLKEFLKGVHEPLIMNYRVNAGYIKPDHWVHDPTQGGGRIIGEACHFVDFLTFLTDTVPVRVSTQRLPNCSRYCDDNVIISLKFADGSIGSVTYAANADKTFPKERVEVLGGGSSSRTR
ncbi:bi-domain-containing oxidoreductase [Acidobacteria bacterium AH-259-A15]|nr:bi-domain-containing oxidoreductase [Acidobacteria bacterium AH-259-A15]